MEVRCDGCGRLFTDDDFVHGGIVRYGGKVYCASCAEKMWPQTTAEVVVPSEEVPRQQEQVPKRCAACNTEFTGNGPLCPACKAKRPILCSRCGKPVSINDIQTDKALTTDDGKVFCPACVELVRPLFEAMGGKLPQTTDETSEAEDAPVVVPVAERRVLPIEPTERGGNPLIWIVLIFFVVIAIIGIASFGGGPSGGGFSPRNPNPITSHPPITSPPTTPPKNPVRDPFNNHKMYTDEERKHIEEVKEQIKTVVAQWGPQKHKEIIRQLEEIAVGEDIEIEMEVEKAKERLQKRLTEAAKKEFDRILNRVNEAHKNENYEKEIELLSGVSEWIKEAGDFGEKVKRLIELKLREAQRLDTAKKAAMKALEETDALIGKKSFEAAKKILEQALKTCEGTKYAKPLKERLEEVDRRLETRLKTEFGKAWSELQKDVEAAFKRGLYGKVKEMVDAFRQRYGRILVGRRDVEENLREYERRCEAGEVVEKAAEILKEARKAGGKRASWDKLKSIWLKFLRLKVSILWKQLPKEIIAHLERYEKQLGAMVAAVGKGEWVDVAPFYTPLGMKKTGFTRLGGEYKKYDQPNYRVRFLRPHKAKLVRYIITYRCDKFIDEQKKILPPLFLVKIPDAKKIETVWTHFHFEAKDQIASRLLELNTASAHSFVGGSPFPVGKGPFHLLFDAANIICVQRKNGKLDFIRENLNLLPAIRKGEFPVSVQVTTTAATGAGSWTTFVLWVRYKGAPRSLPKKGVWLSVIRPYDLNFWTFPFPSIIELSDEGFTVENRIGRDAISFFYNAPFMAHLKNYRIRFKVTLVKGRFGVCVRATHPLKPIPHLQMIIKSHLPGMTETYEFVFRGKRIYAVRGGQEKELPGRAHSDTGTFGFALRKDTKLIIHWCEIMPE